MKNVEIAVVGKSSAGKSAFIRSFSSASDYIDSIGKGQTTRAYAEYFLLKEYDSDYPTAEARIATKTEFSEARALQFSEKLSKEINDQKKHDIAWVKEQLECETYEARLKNFLLLSDDFFNINEFLFLDADIVNNADEIYYNLRTQIFNFKSLCSDSNVDNIDMATDSLDKFLIDFYEEIYELILVSIETKYSQNPIYVKENNISTFKFDVNNQTKSMLSLLLKVDNETKYSFTGIITKVRISSKLSPQYMPLLSELGFDNIVLIDTYGLDHSQGIEKDVLVERYNKIFNKDYPDISTVFLVEALHTGASSDFKNAITTLYEVKPEIMTYVIGTHIDENETVLCNNREWLYSEDKTKFKQPSLNGKVLQMLDKSINLKATLLDNGISESMAAKRCEVMLKRFCPFCGDLSKSSETIDYRKTNFICVRSVFLSIKDREHLGDGYIEIDKIRKGYSNIEISEVFAKPFINNTSKRFNQIFNASASRTKWKIRENLEHYILGFDGTTIDATWIRILRDAFNQTFTKPIITPAGKIMLSDALKLEGNSKIAFDEIIAKMYPYIFKRPCHLETKFSYYDNQINCISCATHKTPEDCIWNFFITAATYEKFQKRNDYARVIDWLEALHDFSSENTALTKNIAHYFCQIMNVQLIELCQMRNIYIASQKILASENSFVDAKRKIYNDYRNGFDSEINEADFYMRINRCLSHTDADSQ